MLADTTLPKSLQYDPKSKIKNYKFNEDFDNIRLNLSGTGILFEDPGFFYWLGGHDKEWRRPKEICDHPYFIKGKPHRFDALQGDIAEDCWLVAAMQALTMNDDLIHHVVPHDQLFNQNYIGAFHFRIWQLGTWYDVVVDDRLPVWQSDRKPINTYSLSGDVFWACLLEKAYAKVSGCDSYLCLPGGVSTTALQDFSGGIVERVFTHDPPNGLSIKWFIDKVFHSDALMCCRCFMNVGQTTTDLWPQHAYTISGVHKFSSHDPTYPNVYVIRIMNPTQTEWTGDWSDNSVQWMNVDHKIRQRLSLKVEEDGEFWMEFDDFVKYFQKLYICHLGPGQYAKSRWEGNVETWKTLTFHGEWVKDVSAGGSNNATRYMNPQYRFDLHIEDDTNYDSKISVVIELTQRYQNYRKLKRNIRFYIYSLTDLQNLPTPLNREFFQYHFAINEYDVYFWEGKDRAYSTHMKLAPGKYCIIPCTEDENEETQFLLRVYSESRVEMWEYDHPNSTKAMRIVNETLSGVDDGLKIFYDFADSQNEIDWISLKKILEKNMNTDNFYFDMIKTIFKFIWGVFETFIPSFSSYDSQTAKMAFSKDACRSMVAMLDHDRSGKLNFIEFTDLWEKICFWTNVYNLHTDEAEVIMPVSRLSVALSSMGYNVNKKILHTLIHYYANEQGYITLADFILCGVSLETGMPLYHKKDEASEEKNTFTLHEWVKKTLFL